MSLQVWLPLCGNTNNQGLLNVNVTNTGATTNSAGKIGSCYAFNGTNSYLALDSLNVSGWKEISISAWVKPTSNLAYLFLIRQLTSTSVPHQIRISNDGFSLRDSMHDTMYTIGWNYTFTAGTWIHICCTYKQGEIGMYCNGVCTNYSSTYYNTNAQLNSTNETRIAQIQTSTATNYFSGSINDFRIYDHALSAMEVSELAKGKMIHLKLSNETIGNPNLLVGSHTPVRTGSYQMHNYSFVSGEEPVEGQTYTIQLKGILGEGKTYFGIYNSGGSVSPVSLYRTDRNSQGIYTKTFTWRTGTAANTFLRVYHMVSDVSATSTIDWIKLEAGSEATPWIPNHTDADYSTTDLTTEYDCSGYRHDATKNAITSVSDSARYGAAAVFNGSSSYIQVNDNTWMADGLTEFTVSIWMKASSWPTQIRPFCCLESGGFGLGNAGDSGYYRFYVNEYQNAAHSTTGYDSNIQALKISNLSTTDWNHIAIVYTTSGTKTYLNGELHHNYTRTSYGIHFNTGARLFLGCEAGGALPTTPYFDGQLSDFRFYAAALSEEDVKILYRTSGFVDNQGNMFVREMKEV